MWSGRKIWPNIFDPINPLVSGGSYIPGFKVLPATKGGLGTIVTLVTSYHQCFIFTIYPSPWQHYHREASIVQCNVTPLPVYSQISQATICWYLFTKLEYFVKRGTVLHVIIVFLTDLGRSQTETIWSIISLHLSLSKPLQIGSHNLYSYNLLLSQPSNQYWKQETCQSTDTCLQGNSKGTNRPGTQHTETMWQTGVPQAEKYIYLIRRFVA